MSTEPAPAKRNELGQFLPGESGNKKGRPTGSKNEITILKQELELAVRQHLSPEIVKRILDVVCVKALQGDMSAIKLIFDKCISNAQLDDANAKGSGWVFLVKNMTSPEQQESNIIDVTPTTEENEMKESNQHASSQSGGGNVVGKAPSAPIIKPANIGGASMTPNNQSTSRGKGRT